MHFLVPFRLVFKIKVDIADLFRITFINQKTDFLFDFPDSGLRNCFIFLNFASAMIPLAGSKTPLFHSKKNFSVVNKKTKRSILHILILNYSLPNSSML